MTGTPLTRTDFYKTDHRRQYPEGTELVFSNWTPRKSRIPGVDKVALFGLQAYIIDQLINKWRTEFFEETKDRVLARYGRRLARALPAAPSLDHVAALHDIGHLPLEIYAVPEGTRTPIGAPQFTMWNTTHDEFWLTNYIETSLSRNLWGPCTSATIAREFRNIFRAAAGIAGGDLDFTLIQGHDFSSRGMYGDWAAQASGAAHLLSFTGTDTIDAIDWVEQFYYPHDDTYVGGSIPATEHSVMCMGTKGRELETFRRLITEVYPSGPVSIVSDTWDYWEVITEILPALRDEIMAREGGPVVFRPDSGEPVDILTGDPGARFGSPARVGTFELLWKTFGGTVNAAGFCQLDPHVGTIYGDSITLDRARRITQRLIDQGFVPTPVLGIGSYTYQMVTRDTFGFALKSTAGIVNGEVREIFKDPATDDGTKKSAKGFVCLDENLKAKEVSTLQEVRDCPAYECVFLDGDIPYINGFEEIRARIQA